MADQLNIPIFYACDEGFVKYTVVSIHSMMANASPDYRYSIYILHTGISPEQQKKATSLACDNFEIVFTDVSERLHAITDVLPVRDYYSNTTYFRMFIAEMFPEYDKVIYIDGDTVVQGDISELYFTDLGECWIGACHEQAMVQTDHYGAYAEKVVGVSRHNFFNAGVLLINAEMFRKKEILRRFADRLAEYSFVVTQDEDYLNLICKDHILWLDQRWNTEAYCTFPYPIEEAKIIHYIMVSKPWHYADCTGGDIFWHYAAETEVYDEIREVLENFTEEDKLRDAEVMDNLLALAKFETDRDDNYQKQLDNSVRSQDRVAILEKIAQYEREGRFDEDVENDPPSRTLMPDEIEYGDTRIRSKMKSKFAFAAARRYVNSLIADKKLIIKDIKGIEHFRNLNSGAIITCNHFNAFDSFAMQLAYDAAQQPDRTFWRVIREGNYTSFPGLLRLFDAQLQHPAAFLQHGHHEKVYESGRHAPAKGRLHPRLSRAVHVVELPQAQTAQERRLQLRGAQQRPRPAVLHHHAGLRRHGRGRFLGTGIHHPHRRADLPRPQPVLPRARQRYARPQLRALEGDLRARVPYAPRLQHRRAQAG